jgi:CBS domain-containing protein
MLVREVYTRDAAVCRPDATIAEAARLLRARDCSLLLVVGPDRRPLGVVTDRDLLQLLDRRDLAPSRARVRDAMSAPVHAVRIEDEAAQALAAMARHRVRRLPVLSGLGQLEGILALEDLLLATQPDACRRNPLLLDQVLQALGAACSREPHLPEPEEQPIGI